MARDLPNAEETARILAERRTRAAARPPPAAGRALNKTLKALDARFGQGVEGLKARWPEVVGELLARRTEPVRLSGGRGGLGASLEVRVDGPAATLIQHQAGEMIARVNLVLGPGAVERLRIVQGPLRRRPAARVATIARPPLDAAAEQALARGLEAFAEGPLKTALTRLGREVLRGR